MTDKTTDAETLAALKELLAMVEAGVVGTRLIPLCPPAGVSTSLVLRAYNNHASAAIDLIENDLAGFDWSISSAGSAMVWHSGDAPFREPHISDNPYPARAALCAFLKAKIVEG